MTTYFFMGWNRDHDDIRDACIYAVQPFVGIDYGREPSRTVHLLISASLGVNYITSHGIVVRNNARVGLCMGVVKGDDSEVTWDAKGMQEAKP